MADIPLNYFVRKAFTLTATPSAMYIAPFDRASIILAAYATNTTSNDINVTIGISGVGGTFVPTKPYYHYAKDVLVSGSDTTNMVPARLVLQEYDALIASASAPGITLNVALLETINVVA